MSNNAQEILDTILGRLKSLASTDTVVGQPIQVGQLTLLPVVKISVGFAAGGGEGSGGDPKGNGKGSGAGGGGGGGASVTPVGFICYDGTDVKFITVGKGKFDALIESVPELLKKFKIGAKKDKDSGAKDQDD